MITSSTCKNYNIQALKNYNLNVIIFEALGVIFL